jgi:hypothetical protein
MGVMGDPEELLRALTALGAIRMPTAREQHQAQRAAGGPELWRLRCAHHLAGAVECQVLMAAGAVPAVKENATPLLLAGWELFTGAGTAEDGARVGLLLAIARRLTDVIMLMVARQRRGEGDELLSPLIMPALAVGEALTGLLDAAAHESGGEEEPRRELFSVVEQLRGMADLVETMTPEQYRTTGPARHPPKRRRSVARHFARTSRQPRQAPCRPGTDTRSCT